MNSSQFLRLLFISAIWGASHVFSRVIVPAIGPWLSAFVRVLIAVLTLTALFKFNGELKSLSKQWKKYREPFLIAGLTNFAIPFTLFSFAAVSLPASYLVILNATAPIFSALLSSWFLKDPFDWRRWLSIAMGVAGVSLLTEYGSIVEITPEVAGGLVLGLLAALSYAAGGLYIRHRCQQVPPTLLVWGSTVTASLMLSGFAVYSALTHGEFQSIHHSWWMVGVSIAIVGVFSSAIAFVIFYRLIGEIGAFNATLTTFIMPMFGILWGVLLLNETVTLGMGVGAGLVIGSAMLFLKRRR